MSSNQSYTKFLIIDTKLIYALCSTYAESLSKSWIQYSRFRLGASILLVFDRYISGLITNNMFVHYRLASPEQGPWYCRYIMIILQRQLWDDTAYLRPIQFGYELTKCDIGVIKYEHLLVYISQNIMALLNRYHVWYSRILLGSVDTFSPGKSTSKYIAHEIDTEILTLKNTVIKTFENAVGYLKAPWYSII